MWGKLIALFIRVILLKIQRRNDPDMIRWDETTRIRHAKEKDLDRIDKALYRGDTVAISAIWRELSAKTAGAHGQ